MVEKKYSNREINLKIGNLTDKFSEFDKDMRESNSRIETSVTLTNGRVKDLELSRARQEGFNRAVAIFGAAGWAVAMALIGWMLTQILQMPELAHRAVADALSAYEVTIK